MKRMDERFADLKKKGDKALVAYLTAGYPDLETTGDLALTLEGAGVDVLELGIPFSDPTADGPAIQKASHRALQNGTTLPRVLDLLSEVRKSTEMPIVLFSYYNPIFLFGNRRFAREAAEAGADGVLVVDLPREEAEELRKFTAGLAFIPLVAPTTGARRMEQIAADASGFIYYVSLTGVTGSGSPVLEELRNNVARIKSKTELPVVAGFGISTPGQAGKSPRRPTAWSWEALSSGSSGKRAAEGRSEMRSMDSPKASRGRWHNYTAPWIKESSVSGSAEWAEVTPLLFSRHRLQADLDSQTRGFMAFGGALGFLFPLTTGGAQWPDGNIETRSYQDVASFIEGPCSGEQPPARPQAAPQPNVPARPAAHRIDEPEAHLISQDFPGEIIPDGILRVRSGAFPCHPSNKKMTSHNSLLYRNRMKTCLAGDPSRRFCGAHRTNKPVV